MRLYGVSAALRAAGLAAWAAAMLPRSDVRPELFSIVLFAELFRRLEAWRLGRPAPSLMWLGLGFALWANLHAAFAYGVGLVFLYSVARRQWRPAAAALAGTFLQPAGPGVWAAIVRHGLESEHLSRLIVEWKSPDPRNPWRWGEFAVLSFSALFGWAAFRRRPRPAWLPALALAGLAAAFLRHARLGAFFATAAVPICLSWLRGGAALRTPPALLASFLFAAYSAACAAEFGLGRAVFQNRFVPEPAASFLQSQKERLGGLKLYNPWAWGGYFGWRLHPEYRVFQDGRYVFHPLLVEATEAAATAESWQSFLEGRGVELAVIENLAWMLPSTRRYPDGSEKAIPRPFHVFYMPKSRWALVHVDPKALVFVRRDRADASWLEDREFRFIRPHDDAALEDALSRGEVPADAVAKERARLN